MGCTRLHKNRKLEKRCNKKGNLRKVFTKEVLVKQCGLLKNMLVNNFTVKFRIEIVESFVVA